jgi:hypothetical protein
MTKEEHPPRGWKKLDYLPTALATVARRYA